MSLFLGLIMIYKKTETTTEDVMECIRAAGIEVKEDPTATVLQLELEDGSIIEMPPDFNIFDS